MQSQPETLAATPPVGWNSWNIFGSNIHEGSIRDPADTLVASGLKDAVTTTSSLMIDGRQAKCTKQCLRFRSGRRGSNPRHQFGRLELYH
jgi:hypothetical protein